MFRGQKKAPDALEIIITLGYELLIWVLERKLQSIPEHQALLITEPSIHFPSNSIFPAYLLLHVYTLVNQRAFSKVTQRSRNEWKTTTLPRAYSDMELCSQFDSRRILSLQLHWSESPPAAWVHSFLYFGEEPLRNF